MATTLWPLICIITSVLTPSIAIVAGHCNRQKMREKSQTVVSEHYHHEVIYTEVLVSLLEMPIHKSHQVNYLPASHILLDDTTYSNIPVLMKEEVTSIPSTCSNA